MILNSNRMCLYTINNLALWCGFEITDLLTWLAQSQDLESKEMYGYYKPVLFQHTVKTL